MFFYFRLTIEFGQFVSVIRCSVTLQVVVVLCFVPTVAVCFFRFIRTPNSFIWSLCILFCFDFLACDRVNCQSLSQSTPVKKRKRERMKKNLLWRFLAREKTRWIGIKPNSGTLKTLKLY